jgi:uncharacterized protein (TIGR02757 family)
MHLSDPDFKKILDELVLFYNSPSFIEPDPIAIPHKYHLKEDIEIAGFLSASLAWGNRKAIQNSARKLMNFMGNSPLDFLLNHHEKDLKIMESFVHRTFNGDDAIFFINSLSHIYRNHGGLEHVFTDGFRQNNTIFGSINYFRSVFLESAHLSRSQKHISNPASGSAAKRINMFLRWMVRKDACGVDFGLWNSIPMSALMLPLDVHTLRVGRQFGLLKRTSNDWKAVEEITEQLRILDSSDPVKYDFALFGMSVGKIAP